MIKLISAQSEPKECPWRKTVLDREIVQGIKVNLNSRKVAKTFISAGHKKDEYKSPYMSCLRLVVIALIKLSWWVLLKNGCIAEYQLNHHFIRPFPTQMCNKK